MVFQTLDIKQPRTVILETGEQNVCSSQLTSGRKVLGQRIVRVHSVETSSLSELEMWCWEPKS